MTRQRTSRFSLAALAASAHAALAMPATHAAAIVFNDGGVHTVNSSIAPDSVDIQDGPGNAPTTVNVSAGAVIGTTSGSSINVRNTSVLDMTGGDLSDELFLFNSATATISGGHITDDITTNDNSHVTVNNVINDDDLEARGASRMTLNGGAHDEDIESFDTAVVDIHGGMYQTGTDGANVEAAGNSVINIYGGSFGVGQTDNAGAINAVDNAVINIYGGDVGGQPEGLQASDNGVINVFGVGTQPARLSATENAKISVHNGAVTSLTATGEGVYDVFGLAGMTSIVASESVTINLFGTAFKINNVDAPFGPVTAVAGVVSDAGGPNVNFQRAGFLTGAAINLVQIPEPSAIVLAAAAAALAVGRRRSR